MGISEVQNLERYLRSIETVGTEVEVHFDGSAYIVGKISYIGSDFVELEMHVPGGSKKAVCPFYSITYLSRT